MLTDVTKGMKLISLAIVDERTGKVKHHEVLAPLRDRFTWFPDIPPEGLNLNDQQFSGTVADDMRKEGLYRRLFWMHFGGPGGVYLQHVVSITCYFPGGIREMGIEVHYDREIEGSTTCILGGRERPEPPDRLGWSEFPELAEEEMSGSEVMEPMTFDIDGPGGEYITGVQVGVSPKGVDYPPFILVRVDVEKGRQVFS